MCFLFRLFRLGSYKVTLKNPSRLQELAQEGMAFEWFVARQPLAGQPWARRRAWLAQIHGLAAPRAEFRLLLSQPLLGPLGCLQHGWAGSAGQPPRGASPPAEAVPPPSADLLAAVLPLEQRWLEEQPPSYAAVNAAAASGGFCP